MQNIVKWENAKQIALQLINKRNFVIITPHHIFFSKHFLFWFPCVILYLTSRLRLPCSCLEIKLGDVSFWSWITFLVGLWLLTIVVQNGGAKCNVQTRSFWPFVFYWYLHFAPLYLTWDGFLTLSRQDSMISIISTIMLGCPSYWAAHLKALFKSFLF